MSPADEEIKEYNIIKTGVRQGSNCEVLLLQHIYGSTANSVRSREIGFLSAAAVR